MSDVMKELEEQCRAEATEICDRFHRGFIGKADLVDAIAAALRKRANELAVMTENARAWRDRANEIAGEDVAQCAICCRLEIPSRLTPDVVCGHCNLQTVCGLLEEVLASAVPNERDNPGMFTAWTKARGVLKTLKGDQ